MNTKELKLLRGQLRQVAKEMLPGILVQEIINSIASQLRADINNRLNEIDKRQKDIQGYMVRQSASNIKVE